MLFYFLCILLFCEFLTYFFVFATYVFYCFLYGIVWVLNINKYNSFLAQEAIFHVLYTNPENFQILSRRSIT